MKKNMSQAEIERRMAGDAARDPEETTPAEEASLAAAEAEDDGSAVTLDEFRESLEEYSGAAGHPYPA